MPISCRQCGCRSPDGADFCVNNACGAYLEWQRSPDDPVVHAQRPGPSDPRGNVVEQRVGVQVAVAEQQLEVEPGSSVTTTVRVHNTGTQVENFRLVVHGPAGAWATVEPESVSVYPGSEVESNLRFAPPRSAAAPAGPAWYSVRAISTLHPGLEAGGGDGTLTVAAFRELDAELVPRSSRGRFRSVHAVRVANRGNVVEPVALAASDSEDLLRFTVPRGEVSIQPGTEQVEVTVRAPWRLIGRPRTHPFQVVVTPRPTLPPLRLDGSRDSVPLFARWVPITAAAVLLLAALASIIVPRQQMAAQRGESVQQQPSVAAEPPPPQESDPQEPAPQPSPAAEPPPPENPPPAVQPEEEQPPPAAPPTTSPPPSVRAEGKLLIPQTFQADLDEAAVTNEGADIFFEAATPTERFVTPQNGALIAGVGTVEPSFQRCADSTLAKDRIPLQDLPAGIVVCVLTDEGRVSVVRVDSSVPGPSPGVLAISFTTFES